MMPIASQLPVVDLDPEVDIVISTTTTTPAVTTTATPAATRATIVPSPLGSATVNT